MNGNFVIGNDKAARERSREKQAFSLVEVTIALGIVVFALVALFGLLSNGLKVSRQARTELMAAQVASAILAERRAAPTAALTGNPIGPLTNSTPLLAANLSRTGRVTSTDPYYTLRYQVEILSPRLCRIFLALSHPARGGSSYDELAKAEESYETTSYLRLN